MLPLRKMEEINTERELKEAFKVFDRNGNGLISVADLKAVTERIGEKLTDQELNEIILEADIDADTCMNFEEFARMMIIR